MWRCPYCGHENQGMFCERCGNKRPERKQAKPQKGSLGTGAVVAIVASAVAVVIAVCVLCFVVSTETMKQENNGLFTDYESAEKIDTTMTEEDAESVENVNEKQPATILEAEEEPEEKEVLEEENQTKTEEKTDGYSAMVTKRNEFYDRATSIQNYSDTYLTDDLNQSELNITSSEVFNKWDTLLNDIYQYLKQNKPKDEFESIKKSEVNWIKEKEAAMAEEEEIWGGGSGMPYAVNCVGIGYTKERCYELIAMMY